MDRDYDFYFLISEPVDARPEISHAMRWATVGVGEGVVLPCAVNGFPKPEVTWFKGNKIVDKSTHQDIKIYGTDLVSRSAVKVKHLEGGPVRPTVRPPVSPSVRPSVRPFVDGCTLVHTMKLTNMHTSHMYLLAIPTLRHNAQLYPTRKSVSSNNWQAQ